MEWSWPADAAWQALGAALALGLERGAAALGLDADVALAAAPAPAADGASVVAWRAPGRLELCPRLLGPALHVGADAALAAAAPGAALDRFRRATGAILEALLLASPQPAWAEVAAAAEQVDAALPELRWLLPEAAGLCLHPEVSLLDAPRRGAWWRRFQRARGKDPGDAPTARAWAAFGSWCRDRRRGPAAGSPVPLPQAPAAPLEGAPVVALAPYSHRVVRLEVPDRGQRIDAGPHVAAWPAARVRSGPVVLGSLTGGTATLTSAAAGPVGRWSLSSGSFGARVGAARNIALTLRADGRAELTGADAFVGPPTREILEMAEQYGVSGSTTGWWRLPAIGATGRAGRLVVGGFSAKQGTLHPRSGHGFALPADAWLTPVQAFLDGLAGQELRFTQTAGGLRLEAEVGGMPLVLQLQPEG